jgi:hypothetical protein
MEMKVLENIVSSELFLGKILGRYNTYFTEIVMRNVNCARDGSGNPPA